jgi:NitT/TauT family transport system substrate-binding protein
MTFRSFSPAPRLFSGIHRVVTAFCLCACAGALALAHPAAAQTKLTTVRLGVVPAFVSAQAFVAQDMGFFQKAGLDVQMLPVNSGASSMAALSGGSLDISFGDSIGVPEAHVRGLPYVFIASGIVDTVKAPGLQILVTAVSPIRTGKDLNGKTVAVSSLRSMSQVTISAWTDGNGGDSKTVKFIEYPIPQMANAVDKGTVDAALPPEPFMTSAVDSGMRAIVFEKGALHEFMISGWLADPAWIAANRDTVTRFVAALYMANQYLNRHPLQPEVAEILAKYTKIPPESIQHLRFLPQFGSTVDPKQLQPMIDAAAKYGFVDRAFPAGEIIANRK